MYVSVPVTAAAAGLGLPPGAAGTGPECGSIAGLQKMLADLGVYMGEIDGALSAKFVALCKSYAQSKGVPFSSGANISDAFCAAVANEWTARFYKPMATALRQAVKRTAMSPTYSRGLTEGAMDIDPGALQCAMQGGAWDPVAKKCVMPQAPPPDGGAVTQEAQCLVSGGQWMGDHCEFPDDHYRWDPPPQPDNGQASLTVGEDQNWWERQETPVKVAVIGGGLLLVAGIGYAVLR